MSADEETGGSTNTVDADEDIVAGLPWYTVWQLEPVTNIMIYFPSGRYLVKCQMINDVTEPGCRGPRDDLRADSET